MRPILAITLLFALAAGMLSTGAFITPASTRSVKPRPHPSAGPPPTMSPASGSYVEGRRLVTAAPARPGDAVDSLWVDDQLMVGSTTSGTSTLSFDVGANPISRRSGTHVVVNGGARVEVRGLEGERAAIAIPNSALAEGENTLTLVTGTLKGDCAADRDDVLVSNLDLELMDGLADGEDNDRSYHLGDGGCGADPALPTEVDLTFFIRDDPAGTPGLSAPLETLALSNGEHTITAISESGAQVEHTITVNNSPIGAPRLTPLDGSVATGEQKVLASFLAGSSGDVASLSIDGARTAGRATLGHGSATFSFDVGDNSIESNHHNLVLVNGEKSEIGGDFVNQRIDVPFPNDRLVPGVNTITVVSGEGQDECGENRDDFEISGITLTPASGTATGADIDASYSLGDGTCGSSRGRSSEVDLTFVIDAPTAGLRTELDTTALADGEHTLSATSVSGETATRTLVVDNSAPEIASSTPSAGATITSTVALSAEVTDASGVVGASTYTLDGRVIELGAPIGPGLAVGEHTLAMTATDSLGNTGTREVAFTSAGVPDAPRDLVTTPATVSARLGEPGGGPVTATFSQVAVADAEQVWQGTTDALPTTLEVPGERPVDEALSSPAATEVSYQRFDVPIEDNTSDPTLRWEGRIDPERRVVLHAWDGEAWVPLASARGLAPTTTELSAVLDDRFLDGSAVHALVTGEDPFLDDIDASDRFGFDDPDGYDFSLVHYTDSQYLTEAAVEKESAEERAVWDRAYGDVTRWIARNAEARKIAYVAHTGDLTENNIRRSTTPEQERQVRSEFELASRHQRVLDDAGIPNGVIAGNHDNQSGTEDGPHSTFNRYFGPDRYAGASKSWRQASYGGPWRPGDNQNHYDLFSAGGLDFVVVGLSYGVTQEEAAWADSIFEQFGDRNAILLAHDYLKPSENQDGRGAKFSALDGSMLFDTIVAPNPNVALILSGHEHGVGTNVKAEIGSGVVELLADYQFYTVTADRLGLTEVGYDADDELRLGASFLRLLQFDVGRGEMSIDTYSPLLDDFGATEFDVDGRYDGREDTMVLPIDLTSRTTSFETDYLSVLVPTSVIGETTVASGEVAQVPLVSGPVAWMVTARSSGGGLTASAPTGLPGSDDS